MGDKSPKKTNAEEALKSLKEKRADKHAKKDESAADSAPDQDSGDGGP